MERCLNDLSKKKKIKCLLKLIRLIQLTRKRPITKTHGRVTRKEARSSPSRFFLLDKKRTIESSTFFLNVGLKRVLFDFV